MKDRTGLAEWFSLRHQVELDQAKRIKLVKTSRDVSHILRTVLACSMSFPKIFSKTGSRSGSL